MGDELGSNETDADRLLVSSALPSPRWWSINSGNPRMLLLILQVLVREFESRRGEILNLFAKIKRDRLLRAPRGVGKHNSTRVDEGGWKGLKSSRDKNARHEP